MVASGPANLCFLWAANLWLLPQEATLGGSDAYSREPKTAMLGLMRTGMHLLERFRTS